MHCDLTGAPRRRRLASASGRAICAVGRFAPSGASLGREETIMLRWLRRLRQAERLAQAARHLQAEKNKSFFNGFGQLERTLIKRLSFAMESRVIFCHLS